MADAYYDDQKRIIAYGLPELIIYFQSLGGVSFVQNVVYTLSCPMYALLRVNSSGVVPKFIYKNVFSPANKIFLKALSGTALNLTPLCNGVTYANIVQPPDLGTPVSETVQFYITEDSVDIYTNEIDIPFITE